MQQWWRSLTQDNQINLIGIVLVALLGGIGYLIKTNLGKGEVPEATAPGNVTQTTNGGHAFNNIAGNVQVGDNIIRIGITLAEHEQSLKKREAEIREELEQAHVENRAQLEIQLHAVQQQLQDSKASYEAHIASLREQIARLEAMRDEVPDALLNEAIVALKQGQPQKADALLKQIEDEGEDQIKLIAEAAYQRGKIAMDAIRYLDALKHYEKAARLAPDNSLYLNEAGFINNTLAFHQKAINYIELALASDLKTYGEDHPNVATYRNNLGEAWRALGQYDKAIDYYEQALASDLKTYGEDHPKVAIRRNNLGVAWVSLGQYNKAIDYFEQALASDLKTYGEDHPDVARDRNNLGEVWRALGQYDKAIDYYELALASDLKTYGEDHPDVARDQNNLGLAWYALGQYEKAIDYYELALATLVKMLGDDHPSTQTVRANLGEVRVKMADAQTE